MRFFCFHHCVQPHVTYVSERWPTMFDSYKDQEIKLKPQIWACICKIIPVNDTNNFHLYPLRLSENNIFSKNVINANHLQKQCLFLIIMCVCSANVVERFSDALVTEQLTNSLWGGNKRFNALHFFYQLRASEQQNKLN